MTNSITHTAAASQPDDDALSQTIRAAQRGCREAWAALHDDFRSLVYALVTRHAGYRLREREDVDDLAAEALLRLFQGLPRLEYRGRGPFLAWVKRLTLSTLAVRANHHNAAKRGTRTLRLFCSRAEDGDVGEDCVPSEAQGPQDAAARRDDLAALQRCIRRLPPDDQRLVELVRRHGIDMRAIGTALGISDAAARMRWVRLRRRLRGMAGGGREAA